MDGFDPGADEDYEVWDEGRGDEGRLLVGGV